MTWHTLEQGQDVKLVLASTALLAKYCKVLPSIAEPIKAYIWKRLGVFADASANSALQLLFPGCKAAKLQSTELGDTVFVNGISMAKPGRSMAMRWGPCCDSRPALLVHAHEMLAQTPRLSMTCESDGA